MSNHENSFEIYLINETKNRNEFDFHYKQCYERKYRTHNKTRNRGINKNSRVQNNDKTSNSTI